MTIENTLAARLREAEKHYRLGFQLGDLLSEAAAALESVTPQEDADEREAWNIYVSEFPETMLDYSERNLSRSYGLILYALKRGRELERSGLDDEMKAWSFYVRDMRGEGAFDFADRADCMIYQGHLAAVKSLRTSEPCK